MNHNNFKYLFIMELKIMLKNILSLIFGLFLPTFLLFIITKTGLDGVPEEYLLQINTSVYLVLAVVIPFSIMHIGYAALYSESLEKEIPLRMELFGNLPQKLFLATLCANLVYVTICLVIYTLIALTMIDIEKPAFSGVVGSLVLFHILSALFLLLAHGIAYAARKFSTTYAFTMIFYFFTMVSSGLMGVSKDSLLEALNTFGKYFLPLYHISEESFLNFYLGKEADMWPLIRSTIIFGAFVFLVFGGAIKFREKIGQYKKLG